jgi:hypothetical protein
VVFWNLTLGIIQVLSGEAFVIPNSSSDQDVDGE